jgi:hypothetical protein
MMRSLLRFNQSNVVVMTILQCAASQVGCFCAPRGAQFFEALERFELGRRESQTAALAERYSRPTRINILSAVHWQAF